MAAQLRFFALLCAVWIVGSAVAAPVQAATLHAFIAGDTECSIGETAPIIRAAMSVNVQNILDELQRMAYYADLELSLHLFTGKDYRPDDVLDSIDALQTSKEDVVIYYHCSHGFRTELMSEPWPALDFGHQRALNLSEIILTLQHKPQHFTLVLADCCNNVIPWWGAPDFYHLGHQQLIWRANNQLRTSYRALLLEQQGTIVATGCEPGQYSWCNTHIGGHFTHNLLKALSEAVKSPACNWMTTLRHTRNNLYHELFRAYGYTQLCLYDFYPKQKEKDTKENNDTRD